MTGQLTLTGLELGRVARDDALARVEEHADHDWIRAAKRATVALMRAHGVGYEFTTDNIHCPPPREPRAWGPIMLAAQRAGLITNTGATRQSNRPQCHARPKAVWRVARIP
jgi:hypothetical protein